MKVLFYDTNKSRTTLNKQGITRNYYNGKTKLVLDNKIKNNLYKQDYNKT